MRFTEAQRAILGALHTTREQSNAQVAEAAGVSEEWASRTLHRAAKLGLCKSRLAQDAHEPQVTYRLWLRTSKPLPPKQQATA